MDREIMFEEQESLSQRKSFLILFCLLSKIKNAAYLCHWSKSEFYTISSQWHFIYVIQVLFYFALRKSKYSNKVIIKPCGAWESREEEEINKKKGVSEIKGNLRC